MFPRTCTTPSPTLLGTSSADTRALVMCNPRGEICDLGWCAEPAWPLPRLGQGARHEDDKSFRKQPGEPVRGPDEAGQSHSPQVHDAASAVLASGRVSQRLNVADGNNRSSPEQYQTPKASSSHRAWDSKVSLRGVCRGDRLGVIPAKAMITRSLQCRRSRSAARSGP